MFRGTVQLKLDDKGRIAIPAKYRERLREQCGGRLVVALGIDAKTNKEEPYLMVYPAPVWEDVEARVNQLPSTSKQVQSFKRRLIGNAEDCDMDAQGRVSLPARLREKVGIDREVDLIGQGNKFELWDRETWAQENSEPEIVGELPAELASFSF
ncbi:MAG: division/cell wall cluster transcriptional repressor MraZ [Gammaproteobacteria bacterium]|nr:division/cell wall cluster transcriptional repressor MraZ [Gammaproteobacteria bacterium]MCP5137245.1 division/cell wall cluster transcriptional repressor MraZ [Gammaproteobacteria bacterium]